MFAGIARDVATTCGRGCRRVPLWTSHGLLSRPTTRPLTTEEEYMTESTPEVPRGDLTARLEAGPVICAEGFLFELERRGYLSAGEFVPEVALEYPDALRTLHVDFQRAGSDVVEARSEEHTSELQSHVNLVCRLLLEKKNKKHTHS